MADVTSAISAVGTTAPQIKPPPHSPALRKWCVYLARGGRLTRSGMYHCASLNAGPITSTMIDRLEQAGLITLEPTASDTPQLRHVRAVLTPEGHQLAAIPGLEGI